MHYVLLAQLRIGAWMTLKISSKGWVVIPSDLRKKYHLEPGDEVDIVDHGGVLALVPRLEDPLRGSAGMLKGGKSLTKALLAERSKERSQER
ncbi:MAG: AbrB/MazE/SpoVT family DNA-binding domain-containing protein [Anaerolineae bacterium]|nr:MAG: AbrB/MazE/SpoVT family DNA-binding domain-containing protein [Anaerolineae bacterium]